MVFFLVFAINLDPPGDSDLQCETRDLESVDCFWNIGRKMEELAIVRRKYQLHGRYNTTTGFTMEAIYLFTYKQVNKM